MTTEKELEENLATGSSMQSGSELLKEREILTARKQPSSNSEFSAALPDRGKSVAKTGTEREKHLPLCEESLYQNTELTLLFTVFPNEQ